MAKVFKYGDKTFQSTGNPEEDIALISANFPDVDVAALKSAFAVEDKPKTATQEFFTKLNDPDLMGGQKIRDFMEPFDAFANSVGRGYTAGLTDKLEEGASYLGSKLRGEPGTFEDVRNERKAHNAEVEERHPILTTGGEIAGLAAPGSVFARLFKMAGKVPAVANMIQNPGWLKLLGLGLRGGTANAAHGQISADLDTPVDERLGDLGSDFLEGAAYDAGTHLGVEGAKVVGGGIKRGAKGVGKFVGRLPEHIPFGIGDEVKKARLEKFASKVDDAAAGYGAGDVQVAGQQVQDKVGKIKKGVTENYDKLTGKVLSRYGDQPVSAETLRKGIMRELESLGATDAKGNVLDNSVITKFDPELKTVVQKLSEFSNELTANPSLADLDRITRGIGKLAKYDSSNRGTREVIFGNLYKDARESFLGGIDDVVSRSGEKSAAYKSATKEKGRLLDVVENLDIEAAQPLKGEKVLENIAGAKSENLTKLDDVTAMIENLDMQNAAKGGEAKDLMRAARTTISKNLDVLDGPVGDLARGLPEDAITKARGKGRLNLGSVVDEALTANESFREPIRQAIMADISNSAKDPKSMQKVLDVYKDVLPKVMNQSEIDSLLKIAGSYKKAPGMINKGGSYLLDKIQGGIVPRAIAPMTDDR